MTEEQIEELNTKLSISRQGSLSHFAKLNNVQVIEIKKLLPEELKQIDIANKFSISRATVSDIKIGKTWKNIQFDN